MSLFVSDEQQHQLDTLLELRRQRSKFLQGVHDQDPSRSSMAARQRGRRSSAEVSPEVRCAKPSRAVRATCARAAAAAASWTAHKGAGAGDTAYERTGLLDVSYRPDRAPVRQVFEANLGARLARARRSSLGEGVARARRSSVGEYDGLGRAKIAPSGHKVSPREGEDGGGRRAKIDPSDGGDAYAELHGVARVFPRSEARESAARESATDRGPSRQRAKIGQTPQGGLPPMYADFNLRGSVSNMAVEFEAPPIAKRQSTKTARRHSSIKEIRAAELASGSWCARPASDPDGQARIHLSLTQPFLSLIILFFFHLSRPTRFHIDRVPISSHRPRPPPSPIALLALPHRSPICLTPLSRLPHPPSRERHIRAGSSLD